MNIALIIGGISAEREVSLTSGKAILKALRQLGHNVKVVDPVYGSEAKDEENIFKDSISKEYLTADKLKKLQEVSSRKIIDCINSEIFDNTDIAFIGLHGKFGEDGIIQSLLELRGVKYTGSGVISSAVAMDKDISKSIFEKNGIRTPAWLSLKAGSHYEKKDVLNFAGLPCVIKPNDEGSTVGLTKVYNEKDFDKAAEFAFSFSKKILVEKHIKGKELTVSIVGDKSYPVIEIKPKDGYYDYEHKYTKGMTEYICPAQISGSIADKAAEIAMNAHNALGCEVYSRVDFLLDEINDLYCLEVNTLPGMTELSLVPKAVKARGMEFPELIQAILDISNKKN